MSQYFGGALVIEGPTSIEQSKIECKIQLKLGSEGLSIALMFLIDLVVLWFLLVLSYFFLSAQWGFLNTLSGWVAPRSISIINNLITLALFKYEKFNW